jgi:hypothetical protein
MRHLLSILAAGHEAKVGPVEREEHKQGKERAHLISRYALGRKHPFSA